MVYHVIGLMSGSSLDGLDIAFVQLTEQRGKWSFEILKAECLPYDAVWTGRLRSAAQQAVPDYLKLHTAYGHWLGEQVTGFIERHSLAHKVHFVASHGHTVFHDPESRTTAQLGDGAALAAQTGLPVIADLRALDVALGGQGAPIVPIGDRLLFPGYNYLLNLGGIANLTVQGESPLAFDLCPANAVLNVLAQREGRAYDDGGGLAAAGTLLGDTLTRLNGQAYFDAPPPKSLSNEAAQALGFPALLESPHPTADLLHTFSEHVAMQVAAAVARWGTGGGELLVTGGGAFNTHLVQRIEAALEPLQVTVTVPDAALVKFKEALVMALIGTLRWREEANVLSSITGASRSSVGGALWMGLDA